MELKNCYIGAFGWPDWRKNNTPLLAGCMEFHEGNSGCLGPDSSCCRILSLFFSFVTLQLGEYPSPPPWNNHSLKLPYILIVVSSGVFVTSFSLFPSFLHWRIPALPAEASNHHHRHHGFSITTESLVGTTAEKCHSSYSQPWPRQSQELRLSFTSEMRQQTCFWFATRFGLGVGSIGSPVFI